MLSDAHRAVAILCVDHGIIERGPAMRLAFEVDDPRAVVKELLDLVPVAALYPALAAELGVEFYDLHSKVQRYHIEPALFDGLDVEQLTARAALPLLDHEGHVVVAMGNPNDMEIRDYLEARFGPSLPVLLADFHQVQGELLRFGTSAIGAELASSRAATPEAVVPLTQVAERSPMLEFVHDLFVQAIAQDASDVHFEFTTDRRALLRYRIDGTLVLQRTPPAGREAEIIGTILNMAEMNAQNLLEPQDGTFSFTAAGRRIDARVSFLPAENGPSVVARLLDSNNMSRRLDDMGFEPEHLELMRRAMGQSQGTIIVSGPTGSGKTTTLYGLLGETDAVHTKVMTIEDPVEYRLPYITQTQVRTDRGDRSLTFARVLRAQLRQDPDVILVGECRDAETARVAVEAAITGHLVLTTVHAPSAPAVYTRLVEMGVPAYTVAEALTLVVFQRLLRRLHECAVVRPLAPADADALRAVGLEPPREAAYPTGCPGCRDTGYRGRVAAVEVLRPTADLRRMVAERRPVEDLVDAATAHGFIGILNDGLKHVNDRLTSVVEMLRVLERSQDSEDDEVA